MKQNNILDFVKCIFCICIIALHIESTNEQWCIFQRACQICMPFFFVISGYSLGYYDKFDNILIKRVQRQSMLLVKVLLLFWSYSFIRHILLNKEPISIFLEKFKPVNFLHLFFFNTGLLITDTYWPNETLWFLVALLVVYFLVFLFNPNTRIKAIILWFIWFILLCIIEFNFQDIKNIHIFSRNGWVLGFELFLYGILLCRYVNYIKLNKIMYLLGFIVGICLCIISNNITAIIGYHICEFLIFNMIKHTDISFNMFCYIGKNLSMYVYILHVLVIGLLRCHISNVLLLYFVTCCLTLLVSFCYFKVKEFVLCHLHQDKNI